MPRHLKRPARPRSRVAVLGALALAAASVTTATVALGQAGGADPGASASVSDVQAPTTYACPGSALRAERSGTSALRLSCSLGVGQVGRATTSATTSSGAAHTAVPAGAGSGSLLVTTVLTPAGSTASLSGWTKAYDAVNTRSGLRLSAWYRTGAAATAGVSATVTPAGRVSMITAAFDGAREQAPVTAASGAAGMLPRSSAVPAGGRRVTAVGVHTGHAQRSARAGGGAGVVVNGDTRLTQLVSAAPGGQASPARHRLPGVAGALTILARPAAAVPAGAVAVPAGGRTTATCPGVPLSYVATSPTVVKVTCAGSTPTGSPSPTASAPATPTPSATTASPTTTRTGSPTTSTSPTSTATSPAPTTSTTSAPAPAPVGHTCTSPVFTTSDPNGGWSDGNYYVHNNMWNIGKYPSLKETLQACSHASWNVTATADDSAHNGEVKTYPNVHVDYHGSGANGEPSWSSIRTLRSTFAADGPDVGIYNIAYDIWMNGVPGDPEIMIWTKNHNQRPAGNVVASGVSLSGITWDVWATGDNGYLAFVPRSPLASGSLDLKAMIDYLVSKGRVPANSTLGQVCFGVEIVSTDGKPATFRFTDFSVTSS